MGVRSLAAAYAGEQVVYGGLKGMSVLKTTQSSYTGFGRCDLTTLPGAPSSAAEAPGLAHWLPHAAHCCRYAALPLHAAARAQPQAGPALRKNAAGCERKLCEGAAPLSASVAPIRRCA